MGNAEKNRNSKTMPGNGQKKKAVTRRVRYNNFVMAAVVVTAFLVLASVLSIPRKAESVAMETQELPKTAEVIHKTVTKPVDNHVFSVENYTKPFNAMSMDWSGADIAGLKWYTIPVDYQESGGAFPEVVQAYTYCLCKTYGLDYAVAVAMIERESGYKWNATSGIAYGYMQVVPEWHQERMKKLGVEDLKQPYGCIRVGLDYLAELLEKYCNDYGKALTAYNAGPTGAYQDYFSQGVNACEYAVEIMERAEQLRPLLEEKGEG